MIQTCSRRVWTASSGSCSCSRVARSSSCAAPARSSRPIARMKPTRLAAAEFEANQIRWGLGPRRRRPRDSVGGEREPRRGSRRGRGRPLTEASHRSPSHDPAPAHSSRRQRGHRRLQSRRSAPGPRPRGADVRVAMTRGAREFVAPLTFSVLSKHEVLDGSLGHGQRAGRRSRRARRRVRSAPRRTGDRAHARQVRPGPGGRFPLDVLPGASRPGPRWRRPWSRRCGRTPRSGRTWSSWRLGASGASGPRAALWPRDASGVGRMAEPETIVEEAWRLATGARRDLAGLRSS